MHPLILKSALVLGTSLLEGLPSTITRSDRYSPEPNKPTNLLISGDASITSINKHILEILSNIKFDFILVTDTAGAEYQIQRLVSFSNSKILKVCYLGLYPRNIIKGAALVKLPYESNSFRDIKLIDECTFHVGIVESFDEPTRSHQIHNAALKKSKSSLLIDNNTLQCTQGAINHVETG